MPPRGTQPHGAQSRGGQSRGGQSRGGQGQGGYRGRGRGQAPVEEESSGLTEKVVHINRCSKVVKGGRRFSFAALVVVGDESGKVGVGYGKAKEVPDCIRKGTEQAQANMVDISLKGDTIPHEVIGEHDGGRVLLRPASEGTGVIAGGGVRAVLEACGVKNVLSKSLRSNNPGAMVFATLDALRQLRTAEQIKEIRKA
ncbi:MAG: 30S ribosomal protein S5 [Opitutales bacterium]|nr:30S ribosomal protein S5 [Opitutales bacterium]